MQKSAQKEKVVSSMLKDNQENNQIGDWFNHQQEQEDNQTSCTETQSENDLHDPDFHESDRILQYEQLSTLKSINKSLGNIETLLKQLIIIQQTNNSGGAGTSTPVKEKTIDANNQRANNIPIHGLVDIIYPEI